MEPRAHHILIGVFTLLIATAAVLFSLWLSKAGSDDKTKNYIVVFTEAVRGLSRGGAVQYNGIRIGEVSKLELDPQDIRRVLVYITIPENIPVKEDTQARLALTGITGTSVIELRGGTPDSPILQPSVPGQPPIIRATPSPITQIMAGGEELMTHVSELLINANNFLSTENAGRLSTSMQELEKLMTQLNSSAEGIPQLVTSLQKTADAAEKTFDQTTSLLNQNGKSVMDEANKAMQQLTQASAEINKMLKENAPAINQGSQGFAQIAPLMQEMRQTLSNIKTITQALESDPAAYMLGGDSLPEFQP